MTLAMVLTINAIISIPRLDSAWPRNGRHYPIRYFVHIIEFQNRLIHIIDYLPILRYLVQLRCFDILTDRQMEEVRLFCIPVDVLREAMGSCESDHGPVLDEYLQMHQRRLEKLAEDLRNFVRMLEEMADHEVSAAGVEGPAQEEED